MFWSFDTCENKVSFDQQHVTISRAQIGPYRGQLFFFKLTADQGPVVNFSRSFCGSTRLHGDATSSKALDSRRFLCSGVFR